MTTPDAGSLAGLVTGVAGALAGICCLLSLRRRRALLAQTREEMEIMLRQYKTECLDGIDQVSRKVDSLEESGQRMENALRGRLTRSLRSRAMQHLRAGVSPDATASDLDLPRSDMRLLAEISRILSSN